MSCDHEPLTEFKECGPEVVMCRKCGRYLPYGMFDAWYVERGSTLDKYVEVTK